MCPELEPKILTGSPGRWGIWMSELLMEPWQLHQRLANCRCSKMFTKGRKEEGKEGQVEEGREGEKEGSESRLGMFVQWQRHQTNENIVYLC